MSQELALKITEYLAQYPVPHIWEATKITPYTVFKNYQPGKQKGLRLTAFGFPIKREPMPETDTISLGVLHNLAAMPPYKLPFGLAVCTTSGRIWHTDLMT